VIRPLCLLQIPIVTDAAGEDLMELLEASVVDCLEYRILALSGEIDASVRDELLARIIDLIDQGRTPLLIDMAGVKFCDSTGLTVAISARRHAAASGGHVAFCGLSKRVGEVFRVTGVDRFVAVYPTLAAATQAVTGPDRL
jgi:anti-sigma B factor antagonist